MLCNEDLDDFLIDPRTEHLLKVVDRHDVFDDAGESPERLFFCHDLQKPAHYEVEALTVAKVHVAKGVDRTDPLNRLKHFLA